MIRPSLVTTLLKRIKNANPVLEKEDAETNATNGQGELDFI